MAKTDLPELMSAKSPVLTKLGYFVCGKFKSMTEAQADEIIRRCKAEPKMARQLEIEVDGAKVLAEALVKAQKERGELRGLLQDALPHIECKSNSQSGLITEIGEFLQALVEADKKG